MKRDRWTATTASLAAVAAVALLGGCSASSGPEEQSSLDAVQVGAGTGTGGCTVTLSSDDPSPLYVGKPSVFRAVLSPACGPTPVAHFSTSLLDDAGNAMGYRMLRDFSKVDPAHPDIQQRNYVSWTPMIEGAHRVRVRVKDSYSARDDLVIVDSGVQVVSPRATLRATVTETKHPLVWLFSTPDCPKGTVRAEFAECLDPSDPQCALRGPAQTTPELRCGTGKTRNFFLAGLHGPGSAYVVRAQLGREGDEDRWSDESDRDDEDGNGKPRRSHRFDRSWHRFALTAPIPSTIRFLNTCVGDACGNAVLKSHTTPPSELADRSAGIAWDGYNRLVWAMNNNTASPVAKDLDNRLLWYWHPSSSAPELKDLTPIRPLEGGNFLALARDANAPAPAVNADWTIVRESNLAGDLAWETNVNILNARLKALDPAFSDIEGIHHEVVPLEKGAKLAILVRTKRLGAAPNASCPDYALNPDGSAVRFNWIGDGVIVVDREGTVLWKVDLMERFPVDGRCFPARFHSGAPRPYAVCGSPGSGECPRPGFKDYSHGNAIAEYGDDLLASLRYQNWIVKLDYGRGTGDGSIVWKLGADGDFCTGECRANCEPASGGTCTRGPHPSWFSHQHSPQFRDGRVDRLVLLDNRNNSCLERHDLAATENVYQCYLDGVRSRGQDWSLHFQDGVPGRANPELNMELPFFSYALGSAQRMKRGSYNFGTGFLLLQPAPVPQLSASTEVALDDQDIPQVVYGYASEPPEGVSSGKPSLVYRSFRLRTMYDRP